MVEGALKYAGLSDLEIEDEKTQMNYHPSILHSLFCGLGKKNRKFENSP
jgi:hypothetical protein